MAIEIIGIGSGPPEFGHSAFIDPAVTALANNTNLERIVLTGLQPPSKDKAISVRDAQDLVDLGSQIRDASQRGDKFREIVVYLGKKQGSDQKVGAIPFVGVKRSVPVPYAGDIDAILTDFNSDSDILIVHSHPTSAHASYADVSALQKMAEAVSLRSNRTHKVSLLIIGVEDNTVFLHTYDSSGKYIPPIDLNDVLNKERLSLPQLDRLFLLKYSGNKFDRQSNVFSPVWSGDSDLYPTEIPGTGLLFPGKTETPPSLQILPPNTSLTELRHILRILHSDNNAVKPPIIYTEQNGVIQPLIHMVKGQEYGYLLNGIPYFATPTGTFLTSRPLLKIPEGVVLANYGLSLTGMGTVHPVELVALPMSKVQALIGPTIS